MKQLEHGYRVVVVKRSEAQDVVEGVNNLLQLHRPNCGVVTEQDLRDRSGSKLILLVAWHKSEVVGMGTINFVRTLERQYYLIDHVVVLPQHRHKGVATEIIRQIVFVAHTNRWPDYVELMCGKDNREAEALYREFGFRPLDATTLRLDIA